MPSPINMPTPAFASAVTNDTDAEFVVLVSPKVIVDDPQFDVVLHGLVDVTFGADATAITLKLKRGSTTGGTAVTKGDTWGPFTVTGSTEAQFAVSGFDSSPEAFDEVYVLTATLAGNDTTSTVNAAFLEALVIART
jgi:hypothetical protein